MRKHGDASRWVEISAACCKFHDVEAHKPDIHHIACDAGHADALAHADTVAPNEKEIGGDQYQDGLQANGNAGRDESRKCGERTELADKSENENDAHQEADHEAPDGEELAATANVLDGAECSPSPHFQKHKT